MIRSAECVVCFQIVMADLPKGAQINAVFHVKRLADYILSSILNLIHIGR